MFLAGALALLLTSCKSDIPAQPTGSTALRIETAAAATYSGGKVQLRAIFEDENGDTTDVTAEAVWANTPAIAGVIGADGLFTSINNLTGTEHVTAEYRSRTAVTDIQVEPRASVLGVSPVLCNLAAGDRLQFRAAVVFPNGSEDWVTDRVTWSVVPGVAGSISEDGLFESLPGAMGTEKIVAEYHGRSHESKVEIAAVYRSRFPFVEIPAGEFVMGANDGNDDEKPEHTVFLDAFEIGQYEITNRQYADYLNEAIARGEVRHEIGIISKGRPPFYFIGMGKIFAPEFSNQYIHFVPGDSEEDGTFEVTGGFENYPVGRLTWYGAAAFCDFYGLRLPSEAEWEKAARGGQQQVYATADGTISHDLANIAGVGQRDTFDEAAPVGSFPPNPFGIYDMAGNVFEFVCDFYAADYYTSSPARNPTGPFSKDSIQERRVLLEWLHRGGSWINTSANVTTTRRGLLVEPHDNVVILEWAGFRVAR